MGLTEDIKNRIEKKEGEIKQWQAQVEKLSGARMLVLDQIARAMGAIEELKSLDKDKAKES